MLARKIQDVIYITIALLLKARLIKFKSLVERWPAWSPPSSIFVLSLAKN
jgi:hypothetical protein